MTRNPPACRGTRSVVTRSPTATLPMPGRRSRIGRHPPTGSCRPPPSPLSIHRHPRRPRREPLDTTHPLQFLSRTQPVTYCNSAITQQCRLGGLECLRWKLERPGFSLAIRGVRSRSWRRDPPSGWTIRRCVIMWFARRPTASGCSAPALIGGAGWCRVLPRPSHDPLGQAHRRRPDGSGRSDELITIIMSLYAQGRFPFDRLVQYFDLADVQTALEQSYAGEVIKPILRMPELGSPPVQ
jgi:hypothetical protein